MTRGGGAAVQSPVGPAETVELVGHVLDTGLLARMLDDVRALGGDYHIERLSVGRDHEETSTVRLRVSAPDQRALDSVVMRLHAHGGNPVAAGEARLVPASADGVFPADFYATTNLPTQLRVGGSWLDVANPEMDCGIVVDRTSEPPQVRTIPVSDVLAGDLVVCGTSGVRVSPPLTRDAAGEADFGFMASEVSSEKPQAVVVRQVAERMRETRASGREILWVVGPAVVHTGAAPALAALVADGWVDVFFGGNAIATHDVEQAMFNTSLGVDLSAGRGVEHGHEHHLRAINTVRAAGSLAAAVASGALTSGVMHALVTAGRPYVLVGSARDDGPLPDVITDVVEGQRAMRAHVPTVGFAIVVATMLHGVATGNVLPASVPLVCVDINPATVTKLADRGSAHAEGVVTDVGLFVTALAHELTGYTG